MKKVIDLILLFMTGLIISIGIIIFVCLFAVFCSSKEEPVVSQPVVSQPVVSQPVVSQPVVSQPVNYEADYLAKFLDSFRFNPNVIPLIDNCINSFIKESTKTYDSRTLIFRKCLINSLKNKKLIEKAKDIISLYEKNELSADEKFKGSIVLIYGKSSIVELDFTDTPFIKLDAKNYGFKYLRAEFKKEDSFVKKIEKDDFVYLSCIGAGELTGDPLFNDCRIVYIENHKKIKIQAEAEEENRMSKFFLENESEKYPASCCKICIKGCACGNSCISCEKTCRKGPGCACDL
jgi:hypothetical protein